MNPNLFLADFSHIANAPKGINRLREMIYNLAVTGSLSEQRPDEGDGHSLLKEIEAKKKTLSDTGMFKRSLKLENLRDAFNENLPKIPFSWAWSRLVEVGEISPKNEAEDATIAAFASMSAISEMHSSIVASEDRPWGNIKKGYTHFADGDVVLAKITPCFENGKAAVMSNLTNGIGAGTTELHVVRPLHGLIEPGYIYVFLRSPYFKIVGERHMTGTAGQKRLPTEYFATRPFPIPPLAEQKRIVAKVDELMALCDQLETQQQERIRLFPVLSRTCHARFAEAPTPANLNRIFDETGTVSLNDLKATILSLAVEGKLLPQDLDDEPIALSLAKNDSHRQEWASKDRRADYKNQSLLSQEDCWDIADSWEWRGLADLVLFVDYRGKTPTKTSEGVRLLTAKNVRKGEINLLPEEFLSEADYQKWMTRGFPKPGDVLFTTEAPMGNAAVVNLTERFALAQRVICFQSYGAIEPSFLVIQILSDGFQRILDKNGTGVTAKGIKASKLKRLPIAVPPLAEQRRIVAKVDELMEMIDQLEAQQKERDRLAKAFAKACVASFTGTTELERPEKMKAPKTELISLVTLGKKPKPDAKAPLAQLLIQSKGTMSAKSLWQQSNYSKDISAFYQQLKVEIAQGWICPPAAAEVKILEEA